MPAVVDVDVRDVAAPWLTVDQAAARAQLGKKTLYSAVRAGKLRAARVGGRRQLRFKAEWIDSWLESTAPHEAPPTTTRPRLLPVA